MDVDCEVCGHRARVDEADVARAPVEVTCSACGASRLVTKSGHSIAPPRRIAHDEPVDLGALADADVDRLSDLASLAEQSNAGRASPLPLDELIEVPPSVRAVIRGSLPPAPPEVDAAPPFDARTAAPPPR